MKFQIIKPFNCFLPSNNEGIYNHEKIHQILDYSKSCDSIESYEKKFKPTKDVNEEFGEILMNLQNLSEEETSEKLMKSVMFFNSNEL
jgi:hypothetical protein